MTVEFKNGALATHDQCYWSLSYFPKSSLDMKEASQELREKLTDSVRLRMISDVPLGAFLSGGIDSSVVVGLMAQLSNRPIKTFSIGFEQEAYNELKFAKVIAEKWKTDHTEFMVTPETSDISPMLAQHYGEPYCDSSAIPTYYVAKLTRQHVTVALTGDGGDESFAGYDRYLANRLGEQIRTIPGSRYWTKWISAIMPDSDDFRNKVRRAKRFLRASTYPMSFRYDQWLGCFTARERRNILNDSVWLKMRQLSAGPEQWLDDRFDDFRHLDPVDRVMAVDIASYLPYDLLVKVDIAAMASSLEARSPFLDHEVMEFAASLPSHYKLNGFTSKYLLKKTFKDCIPRELRSRAKSGFGVPLANWLRGPLAPMMRELLSAEAVRQRGLFNPLEITARVEEHISGKTDSATQLWCLLMLELWYRTMVDRRPL